MAAEPARRQGIFTWQDYCSWPDGERWELIGGEPVAMSPASLNRHQLVCGALFVGLSLHLRGKPCRPLISPSDVKLSDLDVVQPDILVVCDPKQFKGTHIEGPPALVVEVLSPSSELYDRGRKLELYARFGVKEVWLVMPYPSGVEVLVLDQGGYRIHKLYRRQDTLLSPSFPELRLPLQDVFDFPLAPEEVILEVKESPAPYTPGWQPKATSPGAVAGADSAP
jgi:Uma2 family endonuclease